MPNPDTEIPEEIEGVEEEEVAAGEGRSVPKLLLLLIPAILLPAAGGAFLAFNQYARLAEAAVSAGIEIGIVKAEDKPKPVRYGQFATINDILVNPAGSGGKRFLALTMGVETQSSAVIAELDQKEIVIRDAILRHLSQYTDQELAAIEMRPRLKDELQQELNTILQKGTIDRLYFTQYILQ